MIYIGETEKRENKRVYVRNKHMHIKCVVVELIELIELIELVELIKSMWICLARLFAL